MQETYDAVNGSRGRADQPVMIESGAIRHGLMLELNELLVLDYVHTRGTTTRPEIAASLDLSAATVSRIVRRLVGRDLVREEPGQSTGGRPRTTSASIRSRAPSLASTSGAPSATPCWPTWRVMCSSRRYGPSDADGGPFETLVEMDRPADPTPRARRRSAGRGGGGRAGHRRSGERYGHRWAERALARFSAGVAAT